MYSNKTCIVIIYIFFIPGKHLSALPAKWTWLTVNEPKTNLETSSTMRWKIHRIGYWPVKSGQNSYFCGLPRTFCSETISITNNFCTEDSHIRKWTVGYSRFLLSVHFFQWKDRPQHIDGYQLLLVIFIDFKQLGLVYSYIVK